MRILLIEDDERVARAIAKNLKAEKYAVDIAADGIAGEVLAKTNPYDVIVLDRMLPRQDGLSTCTHLRQDGVLTPILMLTALGEVEDRIEGLDSGADDYLPKPFHSGELLARIRSLVRRPTDVRTAVIERFGLQLDARTHQVRRNGVEIPLTSKEFALLELFMMHPNHILTREAISEHVWDMNFEPRSNVIETFVKFLRQKIDRDFDPPLIHTVRGAGYMFSDRRP
jgi:DNA-binding response OmpR family regulator